MKCNICDRQLKSDEIKYNEDHDSYDPCGVCLEVIENVFEPYNEDEITYLLDEEFPEDEEPE